jgi:hypothetical protein
MALASGLCHRHLIGRCTASHSVERNTPCLKLLPHHSLHAASRLASPVRRTRGACHAGSESTGGASASEAQICVSVYACRWALSRPCHLHDAAMIDTRLLCAVHDLVACRRQRRQPRVALQGGASEARAVRRCGEGRRTRGVRQVQHLLCIGNAAAPDTGLHTRTVSCDAPVQGKSHRCRSSGARRTAPMQTSLSARGNSTQRASRHARRPAMMTCEVSCETATCAS